MKIMKKFLSLSSMLLCFTPVNSMEITEQSTSNPKELSQKIYDNIATFEISKIKKLLDKGATVDYPQAGKKPILMFTLNDYEKTKFLLDNGANIDQTYKKKTPLKIVMQKKNCCLSFIKLLLTYNPQDKCLDTLVHRNSPRLANLFIDEGHLNQDDDLLFCIYESLSARRMRIAHLFMKAHPHYQIALNFRLSCETNQLDSIKKRELLTITTTLCNLSDRDLAEFKKNFDVEAKEKID